MKTEGNNMRTLLARLGLVATTVTAVTIAGPGTGIASALIASNHNEVMVKR
jgi:hypothetical protein